MASNKSSGAAGERRRINRKMIQNTLLIWLDSNLNDSSSDYHNTITQLHQVLNTISTFTNGEKCIKFLEDMGDDKACMIISGSLGKDIVPHVHNMSQVDSIFIFCGNKKYHEQWTKDWAKIKGVYTDITTMCDALKVSARECEQNATSFSLIATGGDTTQKNLDQLSPMFMYSQILKEILLVIKFEEQHFKEYIVYCRDVLADNERELEKVKKFQREYQNQTPIWWYTCECFLYPMLNRALRLTDLDVIIKMGFFIRDLHRQIDHLHKEQFSGKNSQKIFTVYRGQGISKDDFEQMKKIKGGLISFNNFLSTSKKDEVSLEFANRALQSSDMIGVFFVMTIDPAQATTPFASVNNVGFYGGKEDEVLFAMHTVFRIRDIKTMDEHSRLFRVELTLTGDNDKDFQMLTDRIREETYPNVDGWERLGLVLIQLGQSEKAEQVYEILLEEASERSAKAAIYNQLGWIKYLLGDYKDAATFYEKSLKIKKKTMLKDDPGFAVSYNNIGLVYNKMGKYSKALSAHEKALAMKQRSFPSTHLSLAASYNNIGLVYKNMSQYLEALSSYEKALSIQQQLLPSNHPDLAMSYGNIGDVYIVMGEYSKALQCCQRAVDIAQQSLPPKHSHLQIYENNLDQVKKKL